MNDEALMLKAIELSLKGAGYVSPNPLVGAIIAKDGEIIAEGYHKKFGGPHAEIEAIEKAGEAQLNNATLYVTLEPCCHEGKTPPCTEKIIEKKFKRVVVSMLDPNPLVSGMGIQTLEAAGIEVTIGVLEEECRWLNRYFIKHITEKFPYVVAKYAQSFDGSIATSGGKSKWISCEESRRRAHILRSELDAVMIGKKTASADNPELTVRSVPGRNPYRIILDTNLSLPLSLKVFTDNYRANTFVCCKSDSDHLRKADVLRVAGVNLLPCDITNDGNIDLRYVFKTLYQEFNIATILVEGGSTLFSSLLKEDLIDEIQAFIAPKIFGSGVLPFRDFSAYNVDDAKNFQFVVASKSGTDLHLIAVRK